MDNTYKTQRITKMKIEKIKGFHKLCQKFIKIRKKFKASRRQFGEVFIGKSNETIINYEKGRTEIPEPVMRLARMWEKLLEHINGERQCKNK